MAERAIANPWRALYHVPYSQFWEGSHGRQSGYVHLHATGNVRVGRIERNAGQALCLGSRYGWYEREPIGDEPRCPRCTERAARHNIVWPGGESDG